MHLLSMKDVNMYPSLELFSLLIINVTVMIKQFCMNCFMHEMLYDFLRNLKTFEELLVPHNAEEPAHQRRHACATISMSVF